MSIPVVTVGDSKEDLVGGLERLHGPVSVVRRCTELTELLAACQGGLARAAIVAQGSEELTASLVDRLAAVGVAVVALTDSPVEKARLQSIGVCAEFAGIDAPTLADRITASVAGLTGTELWLQPAGQPGTVEARRAAGAEGHPAAEEPEGRGTGRIITVWGPIGSPGRTMLAANMAAELAASGKSVLLVDADSYGASVAAMLGLLDEAAGLAQACRLADQGMLDADALLRIGVPVVTKAGAFRVLTGITRAERWTELRAAALSLVLAKARQVVEFVVIDTGFCLESDEELSFDTLAPRRNGATLRSLELADTVFAVGVADSIGVPRLVRGLAELEAAVPHAVPRVVLNRVRPSAVGRFPERQLRDAWERYGPAVALEAFLPDDPVASDAALLSGSLLLEAAPDSPLRKGIAALVCAPVQTKSRSSVFSSTAGRRLKG